jgi:DNA gyrase subunit A
MRRSYLDYAMSVIVGRALPDARDGLKPVHRRVLYAMSELNNDWNRPYKKSARIVGDVIGKYHPHGDQSVYDTLVRMAQDFSMRHMLVDGQGNFGSVDGDNAAAMRYTEIRLAKIAHEMLADLDKETVDFGPNYDGSESEPLVLPSRLPNLLVNGAGGIAVGMATNIPPHNLNEVVDACQHLLKNPGASIDELMEIIPAPDFPTAGIIHGLGGVREGYRTGRGRVVMRRQVPLRGHRQGPAPGDHRRRDPLPGEQEEPARADGRAGAREEAGGHQPHPGRVRQVGHARGDRAQARRGARGRAQQPLQADAAAGLVRHQHGRADRRPAEALQPQGPDLDLPRAPARGRDAAHRCYALRKARERGHVLEGLGRGAGQHRRVHRDDQDLADAAAREERADGQELGLVDGARDARARRRGNARAAATRTGRRASRPNFGLQADGLYRLSDEQASEILQMRLSRLTGLEQDKIIGEYKEVMAEIADLLSILATPTRVTTIIGDELAALKQEFGQTKARRPAQHDREERDRPRDRGPDHADRRRRHALAHRLHQEPGPLRSTGRSGAAAAASRRRRRRKTTGSSSSSSPTRTTGSSASRPSAASTG